jgi:hypothetical protein
VNDVSLFRNYTTVWGGWRIIFALQFSLTTPAVALPSADKQKQSIMENLLYLLAVILIIGWAVGFFAYGAGGIIHILLVIALIAIILRVIRGKSL